MAELVTARNDALPPQAWVAFVDLARRRVRAMIGAGVEAGDGWLFEGAWAGPFDRGFGSARTVAGTGIALVGEGVLVTPPSHTLEYLYRARTGSGWAIANSLALLLAACEDGLRDRLHVSGLLWDNRFGLEYASRRIPTRRGELVSMRWQRTLLGWDGRATELPLDRGDGFRTFEEYAGYLDGELGAVFANARDGRRERTFEPVVAVSTGYDSVASAVVAARQGCRRAFSFTHAREGFADRADSGSAIARQLGMETVEVPQDAFQSRTDLPELPFLATGYSGEEVIFSAVEDVLRGRLLVSGYVGDKAWGLHDRFADLVGVRGDLAGTSLQEYRLQLGFVHLPLPFVGLLHHGDLLRISHSEEMRPWRIGGDYDRPIPRRIAEEAGVPRGAFGQAKKAATHMIFWQEEERQLAALLPQTREAFLRERDRAAEGARPGAMAQRANRMLNRLVDPLVWRRDRLRTVSPVDPLRLKKMLYRTQHAARRGDGLTRWAIGRRTEDYRRWLGAGEARASEPARSPGAGAPPAGPSPELGVQR